VRALVKSSYFAIAAGNGRSYGGGSRQGRMTRNTSSVFQIPSLAMAGVRRWSARSRLEALASGKVSKVVLANRNGGPSEQIADIRNLISAGGEQSSSSTRPIAKRLTRSSSKRPIAELSL